MGETNEGAGPARNGDSACVMKDTERLNSNSRRKRRLCLSFASRLLVSSLLPEARVRGRRETDGGESQREARVRARRESERGERERDMSDLPPPLLLSHSLPSLHLPPSLSLPHSLPHFLSLLPPSLAPSPSPFPSPHSLTLFAHSIVHSLTSPLPHFPTSLLSSLNLVLRLGGQVRLGPRTGSDLRGQPLAPTDADVSPRSATD